MDYFHSQCPSQLEIAALTTKLNVLSLKIFYLKLLTIGKERDQVGLNKQVIINPCGKSSETFEKLKSNAIGDQYIDGG